jgi:NDP-sugar pyrophosphorylase family protein
MTRGLTAMVLAAGLGTRLRPRTHDRPKALVEVGGQALVFYALELLRHHGVRDVIINLHHHGDALAAAVGDGAAFGLRIVYSREDPLLDTGGAIKNVQNLLAGADDFLVLNADTIIDLPLDRLVAAHRDRGATATLVLRRDPEEARYGLVEIDAGERIRRFLGTPAAVPMPLVPYMFAGVHMLSTRVLDYMPTRTAFSITRETYPAMLAAGEPLYGLPFDGFWRVIDREADLVAAERALAAGVTLHYRARPA